MTILSPFTLSPDDLRKEKQIIGITDPARVFPPPTPSESALTSAAADIVRPDPSGERSGRFFQVTK